MFGDSCKTQKCNVGGTQNFCLLILLIHNVSFRLFKRLNYPLHSASSLQARIVCLILVVFLSDFVKRPETYACTVIFSVLMHACAEFLLVHFLTEQVVTCIRKVPGSNLDRYTDYSEALSWVSSVLAVFLVHMCK